MFSCKPCARTYKRSEHLQRHLATHSEERPHTCLLCGASFHRSDVLRRHSKTCSGRHLQHDAAARTAGWMATNASPVDQTLEGYIGLEDFSEYIDILPDANEYSEYVDLLTSEFCPTASITGQGRASAAEPAAPHSENTPLRFLEGFTRNSGLVASFDCGTEQQRAAALVNFRSPPALGNISTPSDDSLVRKCDEIVSLVKEAATIKSRNSPVDLVWCSEVEAACVAFFDADRVGLFLELYWALWHPNVNFLHRPTFNAQNAKATLIAAMVLIGATTSPDMEDNVQARTWFNAVEEMVLVDDDFCQHVPSTSSIPPLAITQSLQAAYIVCLYQNWEGSGPSKGRIRRFRYSTVVAMARDLGISKAKHLFDHRRAGPPWEWTDFATREQLIRTFLWIFLLDTAFVIFHNFPPRVCIKEMKMHFACSEACFQAETAEECRIRQSINELGSGDTVSSLVERMCRSRLDLSVQAHLAGLGPLNLFVLTSALHTMIFQAQQSFNLRASLDPLASALNNWIAMWHVYSGALKHLKLHDPLANELTTPTNMWKRLGFSRFADEYWLLARLITERLQLVAQTQDDDTSSADICWLSDPPVPAGAINDSILEKYDETSMRQVNDLIAEFQRILL